MHVVLFPIAHQPNSIIVQCDSAMYLANVNATIINKTFRFLYTQATLALRSTEHARLRIINIPAGYSGDVLARAPKVFSLAIKISELPKHLYTTWNSLIGESSDEL